MAGPPARVGRASGIVIRGLGGGGSKPLVRRSWWRRHFGGKFERPAINSKKALLRGRDDVHPRFPTWRPLESRICSPPIKPPGASGPMGAWRGKPVLASRIKGRALPPWPSLPLAVNIQLPQRPAQARSRSDGPNSNLTTAGLVMRTWKSCARGCGLPDREIILHGPDACPQTPGRGPGRRPALAFRSQGARQSTTSAPRPAGPGYVHRAPPVRPPSYRHGFLLPRGLARRSAQGHESQGHAAPRRSRMPCRA